MTRNPFGLATNFLLVGLLLLFCFSLFKNISYPLLWNDESHTAMLAKQVLAHGYPKVHDAKNIVYQDLIIDGKYLNLRKKTDAYVGHGWAMYYVAALGVLWGEGCDDHYAQTARLRIPFAVIGLMGLIVLAFSMLPLFGNAMQKRLFLVFFACLSLLSVSLVLHLREVRYYSLVVFLGACILGAYTNYRFTQKIKFPLYLVVVSIGMWLLFNSFVPAYFIFFAGIGLYEGIELLNKRPWELRRVPPPKVALMDFLRGITPLAISFILVAPLLIYFKTFTIARETSRVMAPMASCRENILRILWFFLTSEALAPALILKICCWYVYCKSDFQCDKKMHTVLAVSNFLGLVFMVYLLILSMGMTMAPVYTRYFIILQPILSVVILLDGFVLFDAVTQTQARQWKTPPVVMAVFLIFAFYGFGRLKDLRGHVYELFHVVKGPLDYAIPFIKAHYKDPEKLIIATNYEEFSFMYYLNSKVIFGFGGNNLKEDLTMRPDVISHRKSWQRIISGAPAGPIRLYLQRAPYSRVTFPVYDSLVNNIPELMYLQPHHLYQTRFSSREEEQADLYLLQE